MHYGDAALSRGVPFPDWESLFGYLTDRTGRDPLCSLNDHMGPVFEAACRAFVRRSPALPFRPLRVGEWWDADSKNEIDVVALGADGELLLGECKWGTVQTDDVRRLQARADLITTELAGVRTVRLAAFSGRGLAEELRSEVRSGRLLHFSAADLFG